MFEAEPLGELPFQGDSEVYLQNGGDPDYEIQLPSTFGIQAMAIGYFWIDLTDAPSSGNAVPYIKFGGQRTNGDGTNAGDFGETLPFDITGGGFPVNILGKYIPLGSIFIKCSGGNSPNDFVPYIDQYVYGHFIFTPNNYVNVAGPYSDNVVYWTGDVVTGIIPDTPPASGMPFYSGYIQMQMYNDGLGTNNTDTRFVDPIGISGIAPPTDGTFNDTWIPWITGIQT